MTAIFILLACAVLNRARGDDRWQPEWLPGRTLWYVAPAIGLVALLAQPWPQAICIGLAYLLWGVPAWGSIYDLGRLVPSSWEHQKLFLRMLLAVPVLVVFGVWGIFLGIFFAIAAVALYEMAWRFNPINPIWLAEVATGALWGAMILTL